MKNKTVEIGSANNNRELTPSPPPPPAQTVLTKHKELLFVPLALVVVNDDSARCKKMAAIAIKALLSRLSTDHQNALFDLVNTWLTAEKVAPFLQSTLFRFDSNLGGFFFPQHSQHALLS